MGEEVNKHVSQLSLRLLTYYHCHLGISTRTSIVLASIPSSTYIRSIFLTFIKGFMDDAIPSISTDGVGSRFVSQNDLEAAKARRDEQWRAAYARLGQEPPPQPQDDAFDGRSLAEVWVDACFTRMVRSITPLSTPAPETRREQTKQEEWEERNKLGNQFRALEEDEVLFLDSVLEKQREEERLRKEMEGEELKHFREAVAARETAVNKPPPIGAAGTANSGISAPPKIKSTAPVKKDQKRALKGVLVKKRSKPTTSEAQEAEQEKKPKEDKSKSDRRTDGDEREAKRRKVSAS
ncbi:hypothetical protein C8Q74DRAFT_455296 [Fomes fomentarius]|nr:hypothetical protein C8Q74DRAFT_455296 [Fomes fomentarius]